MFQRSKVIIRLVFGRGCTVLCNLEGRLFGDHAREVLGGYRVAETVELLCLMVLLYCLTNLGTVSHTEFMWH